MAEPRFGAQPSPADWAVGQCQACRQYVHTSMWLDTVFGKPLQPKTGPPLQGMRIPIDLMVCSSN
jgi:hypothetical protein